MVKFDTSAKMTPIDKLVPYERNAKQHPPEQIERLAMHIDGCGWDQPIVVDEQMVIIKGHGRLLAAQRLGLDRVPVVVRRGLTDAQKRALRLADNKLAETAWDIDKLRMDIDDLQLAGWDVGELGFEDFDLGGESSGGTEGNTDPDDEPEDAPAIAQRGQIWQLGRHRIMCGDSTSQADVARLMGGEKANLLLTDPPYGVSYTDKNEYLNALGTGHRLTKRIENDHMTPQEMNEFWVKVLSNAHGACDDKASYYIFSPQGGDLMMMMMSIERANWQLKHMLVWAKNNHVLGRCDYHYKHEPIFYGWKQKSTHKWRGEGTHTTLVEFARPQKNDLHPTMKPVPLLEYLLKNNTDDNDIVLDIFMGSGSTLMACEASCRNARGMEIDPKYVDVIIKRWEDFIGNKAELVEDAA